MAADANVINSGAQGEPPDGHPAAAEPPAEPAPAPVAPLQPQGWSMPKSPVTRTHVDAAGRWAVQVLAGIARAIAAFARYAARAMGQVRRAIDDVPPPLRLLIGCGVLMLLGVVGSIALSGMLGLLCAIVMVPVCSMAVGALGYRWFSAPGDSRAGVAGQTVHAADLARSVVYVDKKLTFALNSFGSERHQQAVIAVFQAKTAVELALGSEQDTVDHIDEPVSLDDYGLRPRIQSGSKSTAAESNSLAAS